jgi:hypothetical protein
MCYQRRTLQLSGLPPNIVVPGEGRTAEEFNGRGATIFVSFAAILVAAQSKAGDDSRSL